MPKPRKSQISLEATPYYHCIPAFLCGKDEHTGARSSIGANEYTRHTAKTRNYTENLGTVKTTIYQQIDFVF